MPISIKKNQSYKTTTISTHKNILRFTKQYVSKVFEPGGNNK